MSNSSDPKSEKLREVYGERTVDDQRRIYRDWAETYDEQTTSEFGWMGFKPAAEEFSKRVPDRNARVLDAGCGTGLVGETLAGMGYTNLHGRDLSPEMLAIAEKRRVYKTLGEIDLTQPLKEEPFDAVLSVGVFGFGPPDPEHIRHLILATKPGGTIALTVNGKGWIDREWEHELVRVVEKHTMNLTEKFDIPYLEKEEINGKFLVFTA